ncbi:CPBP family intramembrane glutamic endopeptidase [Microbacterium halophytorum]|uniref:CPBP family intramembrane glutamic endopeptidase n=1 Tax=Microbacterium halophytorum TaxID=2067568 RepID=UPI001E551A17|nr:CPBP family intramembrane glutamic endopeptidase [Microbacterium halophytorum]
MSDTVHPDTRYARRRLGWEVGIVVALSLGQTALYSLLSLIRAALRAPLADQTASLNPQQAEEAVWDAVYRVLDVFFDLCLVALVIYLLWEPGRSAFRRIGLDFSRFWRDAGLGVALVAAIGIPGLGLYAVSRMFGMTVEVQAGDLDQALWTVPLLLLSAARAGLLEEVILNGYLVTRLGALWRRPWVVLVAVALLRGAYHLYQGPAMALGNVVMGLVFGWCFLRWRRTMPLVLAHAFIDTIAFVGYPLAAPFLP